ncbi:hypothetical protein GQ600_22686 [Phytophthora cactorum]|nr:hypothetical protein GQ600_22686 [Phytophthora cactorum]
MPEPTHRRTTSELDMSSMRRISDALLLAQNRARRATDRANQAEHVLGLVLNQVDVPRLHVDSLADWEMLRTALIGSEDASSVSSSSSCLEEVSKDVVTNLSAAMSRHKRYDGGFFSSVHFVAGFLAGVVVGVAVTKQWQLQFVHTREESPTLFSKLAKWCSRRAPAPGTPWHLIPLPTDEYSYLMHPATVEVA